MEALKLYFIEFASLFGYKYDDSFFGYLKSISTLNSTSCGKEIKVGDGGWKCRDCEIYDTTIICNECFIKEKHIGHKIYFNPGAYGFCDCGDNTYLKQEGFCDKHKGFFDNRNDLMDFIELSINKQLIKNIDAIFNKIFLLFIEKIKNLIDINYEEEKEENNDDEIFKMFESITIFGDKLYKTNLSLFYLFALKFTENFPYETKHQCFYYDENNNLITFIKRDKEAKHICICPFMQVMIYVLIRRKTEYDSSSFFNLFIQTYINKLVTSLCYFNCFSEMFYNDNLKNFREMGYLFINESISILLYQESNIQFLEKCFDNIYLICDYFLKKKEYKKLEQIYYRFFNLWIHLPKISIIEKMNYNKNILKKTLDICCLCNNENVFENKTNFVQFQEEKFDEFLLS